MEKEEPVKETFQEINEILNEILTPLPFKVGDWVQVNPQLEMSNRLGLEMSKPYRVVEIDTFVSRVCCLYLDGVEDKVDFRLFIHADPQDVIKWRQKQSRSTMAGDK